MLPLFGAGEAGEAEGESIDLFRFFDKWVLFFVILAAAEF